MREGGGQHCEDDDLNAKGSFYRTGLDTNECHKGTILENIVLQHRPAESSKAVNCTAALSTQRCHVTEEHSPVVTGTSK